MSQIRHMPAAPTQVSARAGGEVIDRHRHDEHQLVYVSTGVLAIRTAAGAWVVAPDRAVWVPAGMWHEHRFYGSTAFHTVGFPQAEAPLPDAFPTVVAVGGLLKELLVACTEPELDPAEGRRLRAVLHDRLPRARVQPLALPVATDGRLTDACRLVEDDLQVPRSLPWLARQVGASERTLSRLFRTEFGTSYPQWRTNVRVFRAMVLLAEGATVTATANRCGWATTSAFVDTFARTMGRTPGAFRGAGRPVSARTAG